MAKHTPGPWVARTKSDFSMEISSETTHRLIAWLNINVDDPASNSYAVVQANARAIAAVPKLIEACTEALKALPVQSIAFIKCMVAIAEAEGRVL